ncbi:MAG TPA: ATP-binding protein [Terriglobales bacterium]|nr:ATP-binding protein [Terriglobales bacterium]
MDNTLQERRWFWITLILSSTTIVALVFAFWELVENRFFRDLDYVSLHYLYISRGVTASVLLAIWAAWFVTRQRRIAEAQLRKSHERYRGLMEASPGAVVLYDHNLRVLEWNASAERLYGWTRAEVAGRELPTSVSERESELKEFLGQVEGGEPVLDRETVRKNKHGEEIEVQLSLLPFRESGQLYFLEVTADIRERVRLRQRLIELEKLTSMGQMAAGTAHHLNTPLASMLLRVQMMRERAERNNGFYSDLERLEHTIGFCQQFVRRLLDFSRRPSSRPQPEAIGPVVQAVLGFLSPSFLAKKAGLVVQDGELAKIKVMADRNNLETLLLILLSNALDAISEEGTIKVELRSLDDDHLDIVIADNGCGIPLADRAHMFEPFFTTKPIGKGTGLGLAIAKNIVTEHGGDIRLESTPGKGTSAIVRLPVWHAALSSSAAVSQ